MPLSVADSRKKLLQSWRESWRIEKMTEGRFRGYASTLADDVPLIDAGYKVVLEKLLSSMPIKILWSHLGARNVFLMAET